MSIQKTLTLLAGLFVVAGIGLAANHGGLMTADHPLYGAKMAGEQAAESLAPNASAEAMTKLEHASKRANETEQLAEENKTELANETANRYADEMKGVNQLGRNVSDLAQQQKIDELVAKATMHHAKLLGAVYEKVPEQAKAGIGKALNRSVTGHDMAVANMKQRGQNTTGMGTIAEQIPAGVRDKVQIPSIGGKPEMNDTGVDAGPGDTGDAPEDRGGSAGGPPR